MGGLVKEHKYPSAVVYPTCFINISTRNTNSSSTALVKQKQTTLCVTNVVNNLSISTRLFDTCAEVIGDAKRLWNKPDPMRPWGKSLHWPVQRGVWCILSARTCPRRTSRPRPWSEVAPKRFRSHWFSSPATSWQNPTLPFRPSAWTDPGPVTNSNIFRWLFTIKDHD